jgi:phage replication-related protein YjqB (UPF0714/DUF867 family)
MMSSDWYENYTELNASEREGISYLRRFKQRRSGIVIIAPHGGGIEPGTSEIARSVAGWRFSYCTFEGIKPEGNEILHITSTLFDEPNCLRLVTDSEIVISIHGCGGSEQVIHVGGLHEDLKTRLTGALLKTGFDAHLAEGRYAGNQTQNICNRGRSREGVQLEISQGLRRAMFRKLDRQGRKYTTEIFRKFVVSIRKELIDASKGMTVQHGFLSHLF